MEASVDWCVHHDQPASYAGCDICPNPPIFKKPEEWAAEAKKPRPVKVRAAMADPDEAKIAWIIDGIWCGDCDSPVFRGMCACQREARFYEHANEIARWAKSLRRPVTSDTPKQVKRQVQAAGFTAMGATAREARRAGVSSEDRGRRIAALRDGHGIKQSAATRQQVGDPLPIQS